jgi:hypothetical protein
VSYGLCNIILISGARRRWSQHPWAPEQQILPDNCINSQPRDDTQGRQYNDASDTTHAARQ